MYVWIESQCYVTVIAWVLLKEVSLQALIAGAAYTGGKLSFTPCVNIEAWMLGENNW